MRWGPELDWADVPPAPASAPGVRVPPFGEQPSCLRELRVRGWQPVTDAAPWGFLPYVWPDPDRTWVHDRVQRWHTIRTASGSYREPWRESDYARAHDRYAKLCLQAGTTPAPRGRRWLLRGPTPAISVDTVIDLVCQAALRHGVEILASPQLTEIAARVVSGLWGRASVAMATPVSA